MIMMRLVGYLVTFRDGLLFRLALTVATDFCIMLAGAVSGEMSFLITLTVLVSLFSWDLEGSIASLLGTSVVVVVCLDVSMELARVVSFRHWGDASLLFLDAGLVEGEGLAPLALPAAPGLEKKPRMLCCLPVEGAFFTDDGVFAGVRAVADFSPILTCSTSSSIN